MLKGSKINVKKKVPPVNYDRARRDRPLRGIFATLALDDQSDILSVRVRQSKKLDSVPLRI